MNTAIVNTSITTHSAAELAAAVCRAKQECIPLVDYGIAHAALGHAPPEHHISLSQKTDPISGGILEHYIRDLTVRAAAGITLGDLQRALQPTNQFVPIDADDDITLGEAIHHNTWGPLRVGYGSLRDLLLGLHYIDGDGRDIHVGGRTVKNVAGYDLSRFMVGSLGEMGIVHEATLRTYALPDYVHTVEVKLNDATVLDQVGTDLLLSDARPTSLLLVHRPLRHWSMRITYFGNERGCVFQLRALEAFLQNRPGVESIAGRASSLDEDMEERASWRAWRRSAPALVKVIVPPAFTGSVCSMLAEWALARRPSSQTSTFKDALKRSVFGDDLQIEAFPIHGCIFTGGKLDANDAIELDHALESIIATACGIRVWHARPVGAESIDPFGPPQPDHAVLMKLKRTMDPHNLFNPGRFLR